MPEGKNYANDRRPPRRAPPLKSSLYISPHIASSYNSAATEHYPLTLSTAAGGGGSADDDTDRREATAKTTAITVNNNAENPFLNGKSHHRLKTITTPDGRKVSPPTFEFEHRWRGVWNQLDPHHTGRVSAQQLLTHMANSDEARFVSLEMRQKMIQFADRNRDGYIDFEEFLALVKAGDSSAELDKYRRLIALAAYLNVPKTERPYVVDSYYSQYNCYPPPIFMLSISLIEIGVFCYYGIVLGDVSFSGPVPAGSPFIYNPHRRYEIWRYLSYMFLHVGWFHLAVNVFVQLAVGIPLELVHKFWRLAVIYFLGVLAGSLGSSFSDPNVFLAGASGGVYALMAAHLANIILNWAEMEVPMIRLTFWLSVFSIDAGLAVYARYGPSGSAASTAKVGYSAHFFGAVVGVLVGVVVLRNLWELKWERKVWWICVGALGLLFAGLIVWNLVWAGFPRTDCGALEWPGGTKVVKSYCS